MNTAAHHTYSRNEQASVHGRAAEGRAFVKAARLLDALRRMPWDSAVRDEAVRVNTMLWTAVQAEAASPESPLPAALKAQLLSLSLYADGALMSMRTGRDLRPVEAMIGINRDIAGGLLAAEGSGHASAFQHPG